MKTLYLECTMGAAGDMLTAALLEIHPDPDSFVSRFNKLGIPGVTMEMQKVSRCGITGTHVSMLINGQEEGVHDHGHDGYAHTHDHEHDHAHDHVHEHVHSDSHGHKHTHGEEHCHDHGGHTHAHTHDHAHHHEHHSLSDITAIVNRLSLSDKVKSDILAVFHLIAEAESKVHDRPLTEIHFHEVGTMDAIADVTATCMLLDELGVDRVMASPVCTGSGTVHCAHGVLPVPAPATAYILKGIPAYAGEIRTELCTPTGAALLKHFVSSFGPMPVLRGDAIGYGCGKKDLEAANVLRAFLGSAVESGDTILELECNVDDMTGEEIGFACEELLRGGARDVFTVPVQMKKNRPGVLLKVICAPADREKIISLIFKHTTTIGIRETAKRRYVLQREIIHKSGPYGDYTEKESCGYDVIRRKPEYEDLARIAREKELSLIELRKM